MSNPKGRPRGNGVSRPVQAARIKLAMTFRENFPPELWVKWYTLIFMGKRPVMVEDARCTTTGGKDVIEMPGGYTPPTLDQQMQAANRIHERGEGMPAQHLHIEQEIQSELKIVGNGLPAAKELSPAARDAIRLALRPQKALAAAVIEATFEEKEGEGE